MSHYKPYPAYKDLGTQWLGSIPIHWNTSSLKWKAKRFAGGTPDKTNSRYWEDGTIPWLASGEVNQKLVTQPTTYITEDAYRNSSAKWVPSGSLVMALAGQGKTRGTVAQLAIDSTCNQSMAAIVPNGINARFLYWWLESNYSNLRGLSGDDVRDGLNLEVLGQITCPLPTSEEQQAIAAHLDRETARIDALVEKKTRFIELLREKRQALITHAVTKGLDPNVKMKDSGVEWLGEVPEHWRVSKLKHNLREQLSYGANEAAEQDDPENPRFIRITDLNEDGTLKEETFKSLPMTIASPYLLSDGDVLLARSGATVGKSFLYKDSMGLACYAGYLIRARFDRQKILPRYFWYITNSGYYWDFISGSNIQSTIQNVSGEKYGNLWIATPSLKEQEEITSKLDYESARFELLIVRTEKSIALLRERRSALITAAVTGQIDLREAV